MLLHISGETQHRGLLALPIRNALKSDKPREEKRPSQQTGAEVKILFSIPWRKWKGSVLYSPGLHGRHSDHKTAQGKISLMQCGEHSHVLIPSWSLEVSLVT